MLIPCVPEYFLKILLRVYISAIHQSHIWFHTQRNASICRKFGSLVCYLLKLCKDLLHAWVALRGIHVHRPFGLREVGLYGAWMESKAVHSCLIDFMPQILSEFDNGSL